MTEPKEYNMQPLLDPIHAKKEKKKKNETVENLSVAPLDFDAEINAKEAMQDLIEKYLPYASSLASKMARSLSRDIDLDEVICNARLGLLEAAQRYKPNYGVDFKTFAYYRIKGAIYDGLRKTGWIPRSLYSKIKFEQAANDYLSANPAIADHKGKFMKRESDDLQTSVNSLASIYVMSIDHVDEFELEDHQAGKDIENRAEFEKIKEKVCDAIESLPDKERKLIKMYYFENKTMEEIGLQLELSKSWTCRLHTRGLELLYKKVMMLNQTDLN